MAILSRCFVRIVAVGTTFNSYHTVSGLLYATPHSYHVYFHASANQMATTAHHLWPPPRMVPDQMAGTAVVQSKKYDDIVAWNQLRPCIIILPHRIRAFIGQPN